MYDFTDIQKLLHYSALSYDSFQPFDGSERLISVNCPKSGVQYYIRIHSDSLLITFRGTDSFKDILSDIKFIKAPVSFCNPGNIKVHRGFLSAYISEGISDRIRSFVTENIKNILVCGHSLGGGLSMLCAYELKCRYRHINVHTVVFGCPRVGNYAFRCGFNKLISSAVRIENGNDFVTKLPPVSFGYFHAGECRHIGSPRIFGKYSAFNHSIKEYEKELKACHT